MLSRKSTLRVLYVVTLLVVALAVSACGSDGDDPVPTEPPTAVTTPTVEPAPTGESEEGGGVIRTIRGTPGAVWDGIRWVWDRGSDGVNTVWDGIRSAGGFLWGNVTGLSSTVWGWMTSFWRWVASSGAGDAARATVELLKKLNPGSIIGGLIDFLRSLLIAILKVIGVILLIVLLAFGFLRLGLWKQLIRLFWGSAEKGLSRIPTPGPAAKKPPVTNAIAFKPAPTGDRLSAEGSPRRDTVQSVHKASNDAGEDTWSRSQIHELRDLVTNETIIALFGRASRSEGTPVSDIELMRATGRSRAEIRADFLGLARLSRIVHPEGVVPVEIVKAASEGDIEAYVIPDQYLEWWFDR